MQEDTRYIELERDANTQVYAYDQYFCVFRNKKLEFYNKVGTLILFICSLKSLFTTSTNTFLKKGVAYS